MAAYAAKPHPEIDQIRYKDKLAALQEGATARRLRRNLVATVVVLAIALTVVLLALFVL